MGAAAFLMPATLGIPYNQLILVAIVPSVPHHFCHPFTVPLEWQRVRPPRTGTLRVQPPWRAVGRSCSPCLASLGMVRLRLLR